MARVIKTISPEPKDHFRKFCETRFLGSLPGSNWDCWRQNAKAESLDGTARKRAADSVARAVTFTKTGERRDWSITDGGRLRRRSAKSVDVTVATFVFSASISFRLMKDISSLAFLPT
jgi:hypothetical protein